VENVPGGTAKIIKKAYNEIGAEAAISSSAYYEEEGAVTDMVVMGTIYQHREVKRVLTDNPSVMPWVDTIAEVVEGSPEATKETDSTRSKSARPVMYGAAWCPDAKRSRRFLEEHNLDYQWIDIDENPQAKEYVKKVNQGKVIIPTIRFPDGSILVEPSNEQLAEKLGV
ncbi:MAG: mycoredoxin, partial [Thermodesulfobacteriota bacterium]|nr:mycoredoxin [Thermodesulfobacteriota bacterium]